MASLAPSPSPSHSRPCPCRWLLATNSVARQSTVDSRQVRTSRYFLDGWVRLARWHCWTSNLLVSYKQANYRLIPLFRSCHHLQSAFCILQPAACRRISVVHTSTHAFSPNHQFICSPPAHCQAHIINLYRLYLLPSFLFLFWFLFLAKNRRPLTTRPTRAP